MMEAAARAGRVRQIGVLGDVDDRTGPTRAGFEVSHGARAVLCRVRGPTAEAEYVREHRCSGPQVTDREDDIREAANLHLWWHPAARPRLAKGNAAIVHERQVLPFRVRAGDC